MKVIKRNGVEVDYDLDKIKAAAGKALFAATGNIFGIDVVSENVHTLCNKLHRPIHVEEIQDMVEEGLCKVDVNAARAFIKYRYDHEQKRKGNSTDGAILSLIDLQNQEIKDENANKNPIINSVQRDYMAGEVSKDLTRRFLLPEHIWKAHEDGIIHFHDADYFAQHMYNCCLVNLEDMLQNGTVISGVKIDKPHSFSTACTIATQIIAQVASSQYGGQTITLSHLAPFVDVSRKKIRKQLTGLYRSLVGDDYVPGQWNRVSGIPFEEYEEKLLRDEIAKGIQTIQYQVTTLMTTNGQAPFVTVFLNINEVEDEQTKADLALIIEECLKQRIQGVKNEVGAWITPAFPKLIYVLSENNIEKGTPYYYLTELAAKCTAKRMVPDYISEKKMRELKDGDLYPCMGCRSFLTPDPVNHKYYGRFNQGVVTLNLVDVACSSGGNFGEFWKLMDERLELCHEALMIRHKRLKGTTSDVAPILWQHGAIARLKPGETIDHLLYNNYSTISLGYAGLAECVKRMTGKSHTDPEVTPFALEIVKYMNDKCAAWRAESNISFSLYGTPIESTTYKFAKCLQKRFGLIDDVTDRSYITNSYHVHVTEPIDAFSKLSFESQFQEQSPGGAISYVETPDLTKNVEAVLSVMRHIYDNILYAELNCKSDYCMECGYDGEIEIVDENNKLLFKCPNCGNTDMNRMNVARRVCGYISSNGFNQGRTSEIHDRVTHL